MRGGKEFRIGILRSISGTRNPGLIRRSLENFATWVRHLKTEEEEKKGKKKGKPGRRESNKDPRETYIQYIKGAASKRRASPPVERGRQVGRWIIGCSHKGGGEKVRKGKEEVEAIQTLRQDSWEGSGGKERRRGSRAGAKGTSSYRSGMKTMGRRCRDQDIFIGEKDGVRGHHKRGGGKAGARRRTSVCRQSSLRTEGSKTPTRGVKKRCRRGDIIFNLRKRKKKTSGCPPHLPKKSGRKGKSFLTSEGQLTGRKAI